MMVYKRSEHEIMERIRAMLRIADEAPEGSPEREAALRGAEGLMTKHAIDQAKLDAQRTVGEKRVPTQLRFHVVEYEHAAWEWQENFRTILGRIARTNRCRAVVHPGNFTYDITVVGMQEDVEWVQLLWMRIFLEFVSKINPTWDRSTSLGANVARFKAAGWKWEDIWRVGHHAQPEIVKEDKYDPKECRYLMNAYKRYLRETGDVQVGTQRFEAYRYSFVENFTYTVCARLEQSAAEQKREVEESEPGAIVLLDDVKERVDEAFYTFFPSQRPLTDEELRAQKEKWDREERERLAKDQAFLESLPPAERKRILAERAAEQRRRERASDTYWRQQARRAERYSDDAGSRAGRAAGSKVNLDRTGAEVGHFHNKKELQG